LNRVFNHPGSARYSFAQAHNTFGAIRNVAGNYRALIEAYRTAGVADINGWAAYLKRLGSGPAGPQKIWRIARIRHQALSENAATLTITHEYGGYVDTPDGLHVIDSPSPRSVTGGEVMGGGIDSDFNPCDGTDVLTELNHVFNDPRSTRYKFAQANNTFGAIRNVPGNYRALIEAYRTAGVADINGWAAYLRRLGTGPAGSRKIYRIAQIRHKALIQGVATLTIIHEYGGHVDTPDGLRVIDSPSPLATTEQKAVANDYASRGGHGLGGSEFAPRA
jgi:hypothetical protein